MTAPSFYFVVLHHKMQVCSVIFSQLAEQSD